MPYANKSTCTCFTDWIYSQISALKLTSSYRCSSIGKPNSMLFRTEPANNHGSWDAYDTTPFTDIFPSDSGSSRRIAWINELWKQKYEPRKCHRNRNIIRNPFRIYINTFPAPTGPMTATNWPGFTVRLILSKEFSAWSSVHLAVALLTTIPTSFDRRVSSWPFISLDSESSFSKPTLSLQFVTIIRIFDGYEYWQGFSSYDKKCFKHTNI